MEARITYAKSFLELRGYDSFTKNVFFSDEAHFHLSGYLNRHIRGYGVIKIQGKPKKEYYSPHVTVWCGISAGSVMGPYFSENDDGITSKVTGEKYRSMVKNFMIPEIERLELNHVWFQQDRATSHTAGRLWHCLRNIFQPV